MLTADTLGRCGTCALVVGYRSKKATSSTARWWNWDCGSGQRSSHKGQISIECTFSWLVCTNYKLFIQINNIKIYEVTKEGEVVVIGLEART